MLIICNNGSSRHEVRVQARFCGHVGARILPHFQVSVDYDFGGLTLMGFHSTKKRDSQPLCSIVKSFTCVSFCKNVNVPFDALTTTLVSTLM